MKLRTEVTVKLSKNEMKKKKRFLFFNNVV